MNTASATETPENSSVARISGIRNLLRSLGAKPEHERRMLRAWVRAQPLDYCRHSPDYYYPADIRNGLPDLTQRLQELGSLYSEHPSIDGSSRLLVKLNDGQMVESVLLPREGVCVSTQVGCAVGCAFCM